MGKVKDWFVKLFASIAGIKDSPHKIALGLALGLLLGVFPGTGVTAAVVVSVFLRANKPAALAGSLAVNTWINVVTFPLCLAIGSALTGVSPESIASQWNELVANFAWDRLASLVFKDTILALLVGYVLIGLAIAIPGYVVARIISSRVQARQARD